jgi:CcmD family protein
MGSWGFVLLAYGIVWAAILLYHAFLTRRLRGMEGEVSELRRLEDRKDG